MYHVKSPIVIAQNCADFSSVSHSTVHSILLSHIDNDSDDAGNWIVWFLCE